ncbi:unnamed protein product [Rotaria sp. Silwood2]|nr:unnamed protein product [Rotaria sp. Silwood2]
MTSKVKVLLDDNSFVAQRACYFRKINELRKADALILFHDETWVNINEEKRSIWVDDSGKGRLRKTDGKGITLIILPEKIFMYAYIFNIGTRLGISAMIDKNGFHLPSVDIFDCSKDHSMTSSYFSEWIKKAAFRLREDNGPSQRIAIAIDNATWHSELTESTKPAKRSMRKNQIIEWLQNHDIEFDPTLKKSELLEIASENKPRKKHKIDEVAQEFDVQIVRLPVRHCSLNPMELAWAALKDYIRKNNTNFTMSSVYELAAEFIAGFDDKAAQDAIRHAEKLEMTYKTADNFVENIVEPQLIDDVSDTEIDNLSDDSDDSTDI